MQALRTLPQDFIEDDLSIHVSQSESEKEEIFRLRYKVYVEEMNRGCKADHEQKVIRDDLDETGLILAVRQNGKLIGTCRSNFSTNCELENHELYQLEQIKAFHPGPIMLTTKLMVLPEHRTGRIFLQLCRRMFIEALNHGTKTTIIDCNVHLVRSFKRLGFIEYRDKVQHPEYGLVTPMLLDNYNLPHLQKLNSPFAPILNQHLENLRKENQIQLKELNNEL